MNWLLAGLLVISVFAASVGIVFKAFSKAKLSEYTGDMMFTAAGVMAICYLIMYVFGNAVDSKKQAADRRFVLVAAVSGLLSCVYNRLNINLSGAIDAIIFFPGFNGGVIVLSSILSIIFLKEKLNIKQITGLVMGTVAILIIGIF